MVTVESMLDKILFRHRRENALLEGIRKDLGKDAEEATFYRILHDIDLSLR